VRSTFSFSTAQNLNNKKTSSQWHVWLREHIEESETWRDPETLAIGKEGEKACISRVHGSPVA
jgi:hypothetical protein